MLRRSMYRVAGPISAAKLLGNTASNSETTSQRWQAVSDAVLNLTRLAIEPQTSQTKSDAVTAIHKPAIFVLVLFY